MPENSPSRTIPNNNHTQRALEIRLRELVILSETGLDLSKLSAKPKDESERLVLSLHRAELCEEKSPLVLSQLNALRHASELLGNGAEADEIGLTLKHLGFEDEHVSSYIGLHQPLNLDGSSNGSD